MLREIILCGICFTGLFMFLYRNRFDDRKLINEDGAVATRPFHLVASHIISFIWLLAFIILLSGHRSIPVFNSTKPNSLSIIALLTTIGITTFLASRLRSKNPTHQYTNPPIAISLLFSYIITRSVFLIAYELFLRGCVLSALTEISGLWTSILLNTILYVALHAFAPKKEILASVLFGPVLCFLTIQFKALWPAVALHVFVAAFYEGKKLNYHF